MQRATKPKAITRPVTTMSALEAIYNRRAVRSYTSEQVDHETVRSLLDAAVHAPTAVHEEPWAFVVIQDKAILKRISDMAKKLFLNEPQGTHPSRMLDHLTNPDFNIFYDAGTLIVIYGKPMGNFVVADCWLAAENLMLAACSIGLATCPIGFAVPGLNNPELKIELGIPEEMTAFAPIILGHPTGETPLIPRKELEILVWK